MELFTRAGDRGTTELGRTRNVSKSDDRIRFIGAADELSSHLGLLKAEGNLPGTPGFLEEIQRTLILAAEGIRDPYNRNFRIDESRTLLLEQEIERLSSLFEAPAEPLLPGTTPASARADIARAVCRRAEQELSAVGVKFGADTGVKRYFNRLSDYLDTLARCLESGAVPSGESAPNPKNAGREEQSGLMDALPDSRIRSLVEREVFRQLCLQKMISREAAEKLLARIEEEQAFLESARSMLKELL